jgi:hypothetical protein
MMESADRRRASTNTVIRHASEFSLSNATRDRRTLIGFGVVALVAIGHTAHDLVHGYAIRVSALSGAMIVV